MARYKTLFGNRLNLDEISRPQKKLLLGALLAFKANENWAKFGARLEDNRVVRMLGGSRVWGVWRPTTKMKKSVVYKILKDMEDRLRMAQGAAVIQVVGAKADMNFEDNEKSLVNYFA